MLLFSLSEAEHSAYELQEKWMNRCYGNDTWINNFWPIRREDPILTGFLNKLPPDKCWSRNIAVSRFGGDSLGFMLKRVSVCVVVVLAEAVWGVSAAVAGRWKSILVKWLKSQSSVGMQLITLFVSLF